MKLSRSFLAVFLAVSVGFSSLFLVLASSPFGIWLSSDSGIRDIIAELNLEFQQELLNIRASNEHDELIMSGTQSDWKSVLAIYAVRTSSDPSEPLDVVSMDDVRATLLRQIFWDMNSISWFTETFMVPAESTDTTSMLPTAMAVSPTYEISPLKIEIFPTYPTDPEDPTEPTEHTHSYDALPVDPTCTKDGFTVYICECGDSYEDDFVPALGHLYASRVVAPTTESEGYTEYTCTRCGDSYRDDYTAKLPVETDPEPTEPPMVEYITLYINATSRTAQEISSVYGFTPEQMEMLEELLLPENLMMWNDVLYGISTGGNTDIVSIASTQIGNYNGNPYWTWYGLSERTEWCAIFVSWCANEAGHIDAGLIPKFARCSVGINWFKDQGRWADRNYTPSAGDLIFIDWENDGAVDHVGLVDYVADGRIHTIEGNRENWVIRDDYALGSSVIFGYGCPNYSLLTDDRAEVESTDERNTKL